MTDIPQKKNPHAVALSKLGARKGGLARAASLTPEERTELARKAVNVRWARRREATAKYQRKKREREYGRPNV